MDVGFSALLDPRKQQLEFIFLQNKKKLFVLLGEEGRERIGVRIFFFCFFCVVCKSLVERGGFFGFTCCLGCVGVCVCVVTVAIGVTASGVFVCVCVCACLWWLFLVFSPVQMIFFFFTIFFQKAIQCSVPTERKISKSSVLELPP